MKAAAAEGAENFKQSKGGTDALGHLLETPGRLGSKVIGMLRGGGGGPSGESESLKYQARALTASGLFDREYYLAHNPEVAAARLDPVEHYLSYGAAEGRDPHPLFHTAFYVANYPDVAASKVNPLLHFVRFGAAEGRYPNRLFDSGFYLRRNPTVAEAGMNPLVHYCAHGWKEDRSPHPLFDGAFYRRQYSDVAESGINPLIHYLHHGAAERRNACALFDAHDYLSRYPDVAELGIDPLEHYILHGAAEGRDPHPLFRSAFYASRQGGDPAAKQNPLRHYMEFGAAQGAWPNRLFDPEYYLRDCADPIARANPVYHYYRFGWKNNQNPHPLFDGAFYLARYPDVAKAGSNPLVHYLRSGASERRSPNAWFDSRWYVTKYPDVARIEDPLDHYLLRGAGEGRDAGPTFQTSFYLESHPGVTPAGVNPLVHWMTLVAGGKEKARFWNRPAELRRDLRPRRADAESVVAGLKNKPVISVLVPTFNTSERHLRAAFESVFAQTYPNWELCICDDGSSDNSTLAVLREMEDRKDPRISVKYRDENGGIARASNDALALARGEFVAMLDHDDELLPDALLEIVLAIDADPAADVVYTDQAYMSAEGEEEEPLRKPDWSQRLFWGVMYVGHLLVVRRELANEVNGFDPQFDNAQDYEFMLRLSERTKQIVHVPKILYYWRRAAGSVARKGDAKQSIPILQSMAVKGHLDRMKIEAVAFPHPSHAHRLSIVPVRREKQSADVSVFVRPGRDAAVLERCLDSIFSNRSPHAIHMFLVGDEATRPKRFMSRVKVVKADPVLDLAAAIESIPGAFWCSLSAELEAKSPDWLGNLVFAASLPGVAFACPIVQQVGGGLVEEAGLIMGLRESVGPAMRGWPTDSDGHAGSLTCLREVSAVSDLCVVARRETALLRAADEEAFKSGRFRIAHRSVALRESAGCSVCNPRAVVRRMASSVEIDRADEMLFADLWHGAIRRGDPFHNAAFSLAGSGFR